MLKKLIFKLIPKSILKTYRGFNKDEHSTAKFSFINYDKSVFSDSMINRSMVRKDIENKYKHKSDLLDIYTNNKGFMVHKWHHYIPIYDHYFSHFRGKKVKFLEIGVGKGGSLQMWRKYFGDDAIIYGIDINPECKKFNTEKQQVRIGSQIDETFLNSVIEEMGGVDVILDDGSHQMKHIPQTLELIFPKLSFNGIYMIEDLHTCYWKHYGGGFNSDDNFLNYTMDLVNDIHHWYHKEKVKHSIVSQYCSGIHIHDSIVVLEKSKNFEPTHSKIK